MLRPDLGRKAGIDVGNGHLQELGTRVAEAVAGFLIHVDKLGSRGPEPESRVRRVVDGVLRESQGVFCPPLICHVEDRAVQPLDGTARVEHRLPLLVDPAVGAIRVSNTTRWCLSTRSS